MRATVSIIAIVAGALALVGMGDAQARSRGATSRVSPAWRMAASNQGRLPGPGRLHQVAHRGQITFGYELKSPIGKNEAHAR
jgi:hypothetical protein